MHVCIDSSVIGTEKNLIIRDSGTGGLSWSTFVPNDAWHFDGTIKHVPTKCFDTLLMLAGIELNVLPAKEHVKIMNTVMSGSIVNIPWRFVLPAAAHRTFLKGIIDQVVGVIHKLPVRYFEQAWVPGTAVFESLRRAHVDATRYAKLSKSKAQGIDSFCPDRAGYAPEIEYNRFSTVTGRLTVASGPRILTLKKEFRDVITPEAGENGSIVSIDFISLEARVLLYEAGHSCVEPDLYQSIGDRLKYERKAVKGAVISELYGSSKHALGKLLKIKGEQLDEFVNHVKSYFNTEVLLKRLKSEFYKNGHILNAYERPIKMDEPLDHLFINYYAQSTGVDVSLLGFSQIVRDISPLNGVRPLFLLHDALILDVPNKHFDEIKKIKQVVVPGYKDAFPLKVEKMFDTEQ